MADSPTEWAALRKSLKESFLSSQNQLPLEEKLVFEKLISNNTLFSFKNFIGIAPTVTTTDTVEGLLNSLRKRIREMYANDFPWLDLEIWPNLSSPSVQLVVRDGPSPKSRVRKIKSGQSVVANVPSPKAPTLIVTRHSHTHMVFLCHSSGDKEKIRWLHGELRKSGFKPWLDEEDLIPGTRWEAEIRKAVKASDIVLVCLSKTSITKEGFVQKEIKIALDIADEKPEDTIYIIPARLEDCALPARLREWHCVDLFRENGFNKLVTAIRSKSLKA